MPIKALEPPPESLEALQEAMQNTPKTYAHNAAMMKDVLDDPAAHWPHPVYCVGLRDMAGTNGLRKAELVGWRFLAQSGSDRKYAIGVHPDDEGSRYSFAELDKGPYIDGIYRVLSDQTLAPRDARTLFNPAALRINAMGISAVWLRTGERDREVIIPLPPSPSYLRPWQHYSSEGFQEVLRERAKDKLDQDFMDA